MSVFNSRYDKWNGVAQEEVEQVGTELDTVRHFGKGLQQEKMEGRKAIRSGDSA